MTPTRKPIAKANVPAKAVPQQTGETPLQQVASFVEFFVWLLVLKTFFLPLFIIPTGSMAETLYGAQGEYTCPNCGIDYAVGFDRAPDQQPRDPADVRCPNCRWSQRYKQIQRQLKPTSGDRIIVHGWPYEFGGYFGPHNWDVVVFRNPASPSENYIKRLIGLPGQNIEIINGDIFIDDRIARKPRSVQRSMWYNFYDHDYPAREPSHGDYLPHWTDLGRETAWRDIDTRTPTFESLEGPRGEIRFLTDQDSDDPICDITDEYGYNAIRRGRPNTVSDVRVSCDVTLLEGTGYVELATVKYRRRYVARLFADGRVTLERESSTGERETLASGQAQLEKLPVRFALSVVDYSAAVEIDGAAAASWKDDDTTRARAIELSDLEQSNGNRSRKHVSAAQKVTLAAENVRLRVAHLKIERDEYYTWPSTDRAGNRPHAVQGNPLALAEGEYFVLGDNSPSSKDGRLWHEMHPRLEGTGYRLGTVPADQMIGRAFFVYWPGFLPLWKGQPIFDFGHRSSGPNFLPNFGMIRWIY